MSDQEEPFTIWHGLLLAEGATIMIALLMPITSSKIGSGRGIADMFIDEPSYLLEVVFSFVFVNLLLAFLGVLLVIWVKLRA